MLRNSRQGIAERLLDLQIEIAPALALIDELKEQLRTIAQENDEGFIEEIAGKGRVEVKAGREKELKGVLPELVPQAFLALSGARQEKLRTQGLVVMTENWSPAARPSVTVRL
jgi:hypothetical protein